MALADMYGVRAGTLVTSIILAQGFHGASIVSIITLILGFLVSGCCLRSSGSRR